MRACALVPHLKHPAEPQGQPAELQQEWESSCARATVAAKYYERFISASDSLTGLS